MGMPFPASEVGSDRQKVEFLRISGRPKTRFFDQISAEFRNFPQFPLATNHAVQLRKLVQAALRHLDPGDHLGVALFTPRLKMAQRGVSKVPQLEGSAMGRLGYGKVGDVLGVSRGVS